MTHPTARLRKLARVVKRQKIDALLVTNPLHVRYLTGFTGGSSFVLVMPDRSILFSDDRFAEQIGWECPGGQEVDIRGHDRNTWQSTAAALGKLKLRNVGFESTHLTVAHLEMLRGLAPAVDWSPQPGHVEGLRAVKDAGEVRTIRGAVRIAERAFGMFRALSQAGDSEKDVADAMDAYVRKLGGEGEAFDTIAAVGEHSAMAHAPPTRRVMAESPFLLLDWGARHKGYHSDMTRVVRSAERSEAPGAKAWERLESRMRPLYTTVLAAQRAAAAAARDGAHVREVDAAARKVIADAGHAERFTHGLGHGIGLEVHEAPAVRSNSEDTLRAGMVITLEPGVYFPGFGGARVEDDFLITPDGCERLGTLPQEWDEFFG